MSEFTDDKNEVLYYENQPNEEENKPLFKVTSLSENGDEFENSISFHEANTFNEKDLKPAFPDLPEELEKEVPKEEFAEKDEKVPAKEEFLEDYELDEVENKENLSLKTRVFELIESYQNLKEEYKILENNFSAVKTQNEILQAQLARIEKEVIYKTTDEDAIIRQIEAVLQK